MLAMQMLVVQYKVPWDPRKAIKGLLLSPRFLGKKRGLNKSNFWLNFFPWSETLTEPYIVQMFVARNVDPGQFVFKQMQPMVLRVELTYHRAFADEGVEPTMAKLLHK